MSAGTKPTVDDMARWAKSHGLGTLKPEHVARMADLSVYVSELGRNLPRPPRKEDAPAPVFVPPA